MLAPALAYSSLRFSTAEWGQDGALWRVVAGLDVTSLEQGVGAAPVPYDDLSAGEALQDILQSERSDLNIFICQY